MALTHNFVFTYTSIHTHTHTLHTYMQTHTYNIHHIPDILPHTCMYMHICIHTKHTHHTYNIYHIPDIPPTHMNMHNAYSHTRTHHTAQYHINTTSTYPCMHICTHASICTCMHMYHTYAYTHENREEEKSSHFEVCQNQKFKLEFQKTSNLISSFCRK